jgi:MFS superfamily sulfate permease-like transporter
MNSNKNNFIDNLKTDIPASIVVLLVAIPLCLGIALASGAPLFSGIIAGIVGGIVVGSISKSAQGVSGPAAGLAVIVLVAIQDLGSFDIFLLAVVLAGVFQILLGVVRAGVIGYYFPSSVIKGMLAGIGIIIFLKQIPHAFGYDADPEGDLSFIQPDGQNTFTELIAMIDFISPGALIIAAVSLAILILWERPFMKRISALKLIQGPLVAVTVGIVLGIVFQDNSSLALMGDQLVSIPVSDSLNGFIGQFTTPDFSAIGNPAIYMTAFTIAIVASLETLLCVEATDKLDPQKRITPTNRELTAQGVGNIVSGLIGGLPVTQVIVRSSANIQSGGQTKISAIAHGILLLVSAILIPNILNMIPLASLAAILFVVGYKLAKPILFKDMYKKGWSEFLPFIVTIVGIVFTDLLIGISLGLAVAVVFILWNNYKTPYEVHSDSDGANNKYVLNLAQEVSFLNKASIMRTLDQIPENSSILIDGAKTKSIHPDVLEIIDDYKEHAKTINVNVEVIGINRSQSKENPLQNFDDEVAKG